VELHSRLWDRQDLRTTLFRKVEVTARHYHALQKRLEELYPDRHSPDYVSADDILTVKLEFLQSITYPSSSKQPPQSDNELGETEDDKDSGENDVELHSFLPATIRFLDLSSLELENPPPRLPLPLLLRQDYDVISGLIEQRPKNSSGSVVVSGQPGTGKKPNVFFLSHCI